MDVFSNDSSYPLRKYWILQLCFAIQNLAGRSVSNVLELLVFWILSQNFLQLLASVLANNNSEEQRKHVWFHCCKGTISINVFNKTWERIRTKFLHEVSRPVPNAMTKWQQPHLKGIFYGLKMLWKKEAIQSWHRYDIISILMV